MTFSKEMLDAAELTVYAYEKAIFDLDNGVKLEVIRERWAGYGNSDTCKLCEASGLSYVGAGDKDAMASCCNRCVLSYEHATNMIVPCIDPHIVYSTNYGPYFSHGNLIGALRHDGREGLKIAFRERLKFILARIEENGYIFVDRKEKEGRV